MSGFELFDDNSKMRITYGSRVAFSTEGTPVNLLPASVNQTFDIVFPDFSDKDYWYRWIHLFSRNGPQVAQQSACATRLTIPPQEFAQETNLLPAPVGSDVFIGRLSLSRIQSPSHPWNGVSIQPRHPMGQTIPLLNGSFLIETAVGMARAFSLYVSGGQLKLHRQQSVSAPPGGWGMFGAAYAATGANQGGGGENVFASRAGIPVLDIDQRSNGAVTYSSSLGPPYDTRSRRGGSNACSTSISTNYSSVYRATLTGAFGRRS